MFDYQDLLQFIQEAVTCKSYKELTALIHEWQESYKAIRSKQLLQYFNAESKEVLLTDPNNK